ncbi:hypothetical protein [Acinetobacter sp. B51(2017)]|uniref:hypothetical protein n=1 Tax=Acinetobacter sp. B51(2017) TaxID=2060938 RepID=UPI0013DE9418|nr:hypothetical protein [Acinetobacter sp. B51(2017)]
MNNVETILKAIQQLPRQDQARISKMLNIVHQDIHTRSNPQALDLGPFRRGRCPHCGK